MIFLVVFPMAADPWGFHARQLLRTERWLKQVGVFLDQREVFH